MFDIPSRYAVDNPIEPKTFIPREMKKPEKERIRENLLAARLVWQIAGEEIPSLIDGNYNCSVIMGLDIRLTSIKDSAFFAERIQHMVKAPCVVRFYDHSEAVYSFAHKRLSLSDATQVVVVDRVETAAQSLAFPDKTAGKLRQYLGYGSLRNKTDKLSLYLEATVKAFILSNLHLYSGMELLLDSKVWYNRTEYMALLQRLKELARLHAELKAEKLPGERAKLMAGIKALTKSIEGE